VVPPVPPVPEEISSKIEEFKRGWSREIREADQSGRSDDILAPDIAAMRKEGTTAGRFYSADEKGWRKSL